MYLYIKAAKLFFNVPKKKLSPRLLAAEARQSRGYRAQGVCFLKIMDISGKESLGTKSGLYGGRLILQILLPLEHSLEFESSRKYFVSLEQQI
jgi:hypothetical protein